MKQNKFYWEGINKNNQKETGVATNINSKFVRLSLKQQGIQVIKICQEKKSIFSVSSKKISRLEIVLFIRQFSTILTAGIPLIQCFELLKNSNSNISMKKLIAKLKQSVESGETLTEAFQKHPNHFDTLFCQLVHTGELSGTLDTILLNLASYKEKIERLKKQVKSALFYPAAVIFVALIITIGMLVFVVPQFETLFQNFGATLPQFTRFILAISSSIQNYWWLSFIGLGGLYWLFSFFKRKTPRFRFFLDKQTLKLPIIGKILLHNLFARYARTLSITSAAGLPLLESLNSAAGTMNNLVYSQAILQIRELISTGKSLQVAMQTTQLFPELSIQMIAIGEHTGTLEKMLAKIAQHYEDLSDTAIKNLSSLLEPVIMIILALLVGGLIIAMYLPIFKLGSVI